MALVDALAKIIHRVDDMKGEGGREGGRKGGREGERKRWSLREGGPQEEIALVDALAKIIHRVDDMKGETMGGREGGPQNHYDSRLIICLICLARVTGETNEFTSQC